MGGIMMLDGQQHYRQGFEGFVTRSLKIKTTQHLFEEFSSAMLNYGYDRIIFSVQRDNDLPSRAQGLGLYSTYPEGWQTYYNDRGLNRTDPVLRAASAYSWAFRWRDLERAHKLNKEQVNVLRLGEQAGLHDGLGVPIKGLKAQVSGIALASSNRVDACLEDIDIINAYCHQFYESYRRLCIHRKPAPQELPVLSPRQIEILTWVAAGKRDDEIAEIISVSKSTVITQMARIFEKLGVNNRVAATVRAIASGLINL
jgi:LuxR family transcriptional regulator, quorum-sensing system regulator BjaR1